MSNANDPNEPKSQVAPVQPQKTSNVEDKLNLLLQLMMAKEARLAEAEENVEAARKARNAQREKSAKSHVAKELVKQARCRHLKGGLHGPKSGVVDHALYHHTFIDGKSWLKCMLCRMVWRPKDTVDYLVRGERQIANHTKIGWSQAMGMFNQSTNKGSSSEVPLQARPADIVEDIEQTI
jgi:hypothetical protein